MAKIRTFPPYLIATGLTGVIWDCIAAAMWCLLAQQAGPEHAREISAAGRPQPAPAPAPSGSATNLRCQLWLVPCLLQPTSFQVGDGRDADPDTPEEGLHKLQRPDCQKTGEHN